MNNIILNEIKALLGIEPSYTYFDTDLIIHINTVLFTLKQIGLIEDTFNIVTGTETWANMLSDVSDYQAVKSYVYLKVRKLFDPPTSSILMTALDDQAKELEWRLTTEAENNKETT